MRSNPALLAAAGLLGLAALLTFARVDGPVVIPLTVAIAGAVAIVFAHVSRPRHRDPSAPHDPPNDPDLEEEPALRVHRRAG